MTDTPDILFEGPHGSLRLRLVQYQFPSITDDDWDSNWLVVSGEAQIRGRTWHFKDPCLTTFEAMRLADWLDAAAQGKVNEGIGFTEPNLQLDLEEPGTVRLGFALEAAPPWATEDDDFYDHGFEVAAGPGLREAAENLRQQLVAFPVRGPRTR